MDRRRFLISSALTAGSIALGARSSSGASGQISLDEASIAELQGAMAAGRTTSRAVTQRYLARIAILDKRINSIIELNPDAIKLADQLDRERRAGRVRGPLHGIPIVVKDNVETADKMKTTAGSLALIDAPKPKQDAFLITRLREAGAVILAKTNLSEWANFRDTASISGWSGRGGQTRNPYVLDRNACGSSTGTGSAVAADLATVGVGTETDGSIICPSSFCGLVGLKPSVGLISRSGIIPISITQDTAGPMARSVADVAALLNVLAAQDQNDPAMRGIKRETIDYTSFLKADGLRRARIGVARDSWGRNPAVDSIMDSALDAMKRAGAELVDVTFPDTQKVGDPEFLVLQYEFKDGLERYLRERGAKHRTLDDLIQFNKDNAAREMPHFKQAIFEMSAKRGDLTTQEYRDALETCRRYSRSEGIDKVVDTNRLDAIVAPANAPPWLIDTVIGDCFSNYISTCTLPAVAGYPSITVPAGTYKELPIGLLLFGKAFTEATLIKLAYSFEQATKARRKPKFLATYA
jgi:amidase